MPLVKVLDVFWRGAGGRGVRDLRILDYDIRGNDNESVYFFSTREGLFWKSKKSVSARQEEKRIQIMRWLGGSHYIISHV